MKQDGRGWESETIHLVRESLDYYTATGVPQCRKREGAWRLTGLAPIASVIIVMIRSNAEGWAPGVSSIHDVWRGMQLLGLASSCLKNTVQSL